MTGERIAVFRPDDDRLAAALELLGSLGAEPIGDPMLAVAPTDASPRRDADYVVFTSRTGAELLGEDWDPGDATVCAIGEPTAEALRAAGVAVDLVPETFSSTGLVDALADRVAGATVEIARSDHGSAVLRDGLDEVGAYHHETVLYRLVRPEGSGQSVELAAADELDAALFTSSLTVEHFLAAAAERGREAEARAGLEAALVGVIGEPTRETAEAAGLDVDLVAPEATFASLAEAAVERLRA